MAFRQFRLHLFATAERLHPHINFMGPPKAIMSPRQLANVQSPRYDRVAREQAQSTEMFTAAIAFEDQGSLTVGNGAEAAPELDARHMGYRATSPTCHNAPSPQHVAPGLDTFQTPGQLLSDSNMQANTIVSETPRSLYAFEEVKEPLPGPPMPGPGPTMIEEARADPDEDSEEDALPQKKARK